MPIRLTYHRDLSPALPSAIIFDLDDTLWQGDVDCTGGGPFTPKVHIKGNKSRKSNHLDTSIEFVDSYGRDGLYLFKDVPQIMRGLYILRHISNSQQQTNPTESSLLRSTSSSSSSLHEETGIKPQLCRIGYASRTTSPPAARQLLKAIILNPERIKSEHQDYLSMADVCILKPCDKQFHIKRICEDLQCSPDEILFFDNEYRNIESTRRLNVVAKYCPDGLNWDILEQGFKEYAQTHLSKKGSTEDLLKADLDGESFLAHITNLIQTLKQLTQTDPFALKDNLSE